MRALKSNIKRQTPVAAKHGKAASNIPLTSLSSCAGCAAKLSQTILREVLRQLPPITSRNVLVGSGTGDDAGVYRLDRHRALVQTVDFFTPIVDDAFSYGAIAATNALSDVFAMGGRPLTALNIVGIPEKTLSPKIVADILRGGLSKATEAHCAVVGGHTIRSPEPIYGMSVTGIVDPAKMMTNARARAGDLLVLTKPLGTGIATTAIKRGLASRALQKKVIVLMSTINSVGAQLAEHGLVRAATDITGFGLMGHLGSMCRASSVSADVEPASVPPISQEIVELISQGCVPGGTEQNLAGANMVVDWGSATESQKILLTDAQTSGGLLLCVAKSKLAKVLRLLRKAGTPSAAIIGKIARRRSNLICMTK
ncbi:MAG: selenide, water dikinase [Verrucomicrobiota bacterium]